MCYSSPVLWRQDIPKLVTALNPLRGTLQVSILQWHQHVAPILSPHHQYTVIVRTEARVCVCEKERETNPFSRYLLGVRAVITRPPSCNQSGYVAISHRMLELCVFLFLFLDTQGEHPWIVGDFIWNNLSCKLKIIGNMFYLKCQEFREIYTSYDFHEPETRQGFFKGFWH